MITEDVNAAEVFRQAQTDKAHVRNTNLGWHIQVSVGGYTYTVIVPPDYRTYITGRDGWGGTENMLVNASPWQDRWVRRAMADRATAAKTGSRA